MTFQCPGVKQFRQPEPQEVKCPFCEALVEIWTDESEVVCPGCGKKVRREMAQNCLDWCKFAKECVGEKAYEDYLRKKTKT